MKLQSLTPVLTVVAIAPGLTISTEPSQAQSNPAPDQRGFYCDNSTGVPMTMYQNTAGGVERWIEWSSGAFSRSGFSPLTRCQKVSERLETQRRAGRLKYITSSMQKSLPVVCTATDGGECDVMLFTLRRREDVVPVMSKLLALREGVKAAPPIRL